MSDLNYNESKYEKPSLTVDTVLLCVEDSILKVFITKRKSQPFSGGWALPGTFVGMDETPEGAVSRCLSEKVGVSSDLFSEQLYTFGEIDRDPRMRIISIAYLVIADPEDKKKIDDSINGDPCKQWISIDCLIRKDSSSEDSLEFDLAFDHSVILNAAVERLANKTEYTDIAFNFLLDEFSLSQVQHIYEALLNRQLDKSNFRKFIKKFVVDTGKKEEGNPAHRPSRIFKINPAWNDCFWR